MTTDNSGKIHFGVLLLTTLATILVFLAVLEVKCLSCHIHRISDGLLLSNLASAAADAAGFVESMEIEKNAAGGYDIRKMVENAEIRIDEQKAFQEFARLLEKNQSLCGGVCEICEFTVYNFSGDEICVSRHEDGTWNQIRLSESEVMTPGGITVRNTSVHAKISTVYDGFLLRGRRIAVQNCVQLEINEDLQ